MSRRALLVVMVAACSGSGGKGPSFQGMHPRIAYGAPKDQLIAGLQHPAGMRFQKMVDSWVGGADVYNFYRWNAALLGQLTGDAKYCTAAVASVDKDVVAEEALISAGTMPMIASDDYLKIGDMVGDIALVYDWCHDKVPADRQHAWLEYANQAVTNVWHPDAATWGGKAMPWSGWAIDDPSDNYYYSFLRATMLLGLAAHDELADTNQWLPEFHDTKLVGELVPTFDMQLQGGGSREGTGYGVAMRNLWELYDLWEGSTGEVIATKTDQTRASMLSFIHQTLPTLDRVAPTGDQSRDSTASFFDYHRSYLQELIALFPSDPVAPRAAALLKNCSVPMMSTQFMYAYDFLYENSAVTPTALDGLGTSYYASGIGEIYSRSGWDTHATWVNLIAGPYTESHAHQDQGALMIYKDEWLAYDPVVDSHSGLTQDVTSHGTIRFDDGNPVKQKLNTASNLIALHHGDGWLHAAADLTPVYGGTIGKLQREVVYLQPDVVVVYDRATSSSTQSQIWSLAFPTDPSIAGAITTVTTADHTLSIQRLTPASATASIHTYSADGDFMNGFRLDEQLAGGDNRWLHVIAIDGAATSVTAVDANTVSLSAGGKTYKVAFDPAQIGATLTIGSTATTLGAGVDELPE